MLSDTTSRKALLIIDMLNDFVLPGAPLRVPAATNIISSLEQKIEEARSRNRPVIYICDAHDPDDREFQDWPPHAVVGTQGAKVIDALAPKPGDILVKKKRYSAFFQTELDTALNNLEVNHLLITGVVTNICVLYTVADARARGYKVSVLKDCVAGLDPQDHEFALNQMKGTLKAEIV
jgi:nicotinamidase-related amidase